MIKISFKMISTFKLKFHTFKVESMEISKSTSNPLPKNPEHCLKQQWDRDMYTNIHANNNNNMRKKTISS